MNSETSNSFLPSAESLACIHCGLCLSSCPTYLETGNENASPRGRIYLMRAMSEGRAPISPQIVSHIDSCLGCRACETACPSGVPYGSLLEKTRNEIEQRHQRPFWQRLLRRWLIERIFPYPQRLRLALWPLKFIRSMCLDSLLPKEFAEAASLVPHDLGEVPLPSNVSSVSTPAHGRAGFIQGCVMPVMFSRTNLNSVRLLAHSGWDVCVPLNQGCCGALHAHSGQLDVARQFARKNIDAFDAAQVDCIVVNAAGCGSTLKEYGHLLADDPEWAERARDFSDRVKDLSQILAATCSPNSPPIERDSQSAPSRVTIHDACHLAHVQRLTHPPRALVKALPGVSMVEMSESDVCCGSAGTYNLTEPHMAERLQARKIEHVIASKAQFVVTTNPGCLMQLRSGLAKAGRPDIQAIHLADFLEMNR